jgi:peptidoglycan hydrolase-like protein with peptidoglycan-binding domain
VKEIQAALGVDDDGRWGRGTQRAFNASGVDRDGNGLISQAELNRLVNPAARTLRMEHRDITDNKDLVRQIQTKLGFTGKDVDGVWGNKTAKAFRDYEGCHTGFNADGMVSRAELNTLTAPPTPPQENRNPVANFFSRFLRN